MIARPSTRGSREKHRRGGYAYGGSPFGFAAQVADWSPVPEEQEALALMRCLRALRACLCAGSWLPLEEQGFRPGRASTSLSHRVIRDVAMEIVDWLGCSPMGRVRYNHLAGGCLAMH